jgi:hypothetical protein
VAKPLVAYYRVSTREQGRSGRPPQRKGVPIAVAKLDRLSRDVHFISGLMAHKTPFLVADLGPDVGAVPTAPVRRPRREGARGSLSARRSPPRVVGRL